MLEKQNDPAPNGFLAVLQRKEMQDGILSHASEVLGEAALAAKQAGKKATVTLTLTLDPKRDALNIGAVVTSKLPSTQEQSLTIFYVGGDGALYRDNPNQKEFALQSHEGGAAEPAEESQQEASA